MSEYQGYRYQGPPHGGYQRSFFTDDEESEDDRISPRGNYNGSAFQAPHERAAGLSQRRNNPILLKYKPNPGEPPYGEVNDISSPTATSTRSGDLDRHRRRYRARAGHNRTSNTLDEIYRWAAALWTQLAQKVDPGSLFLCLLVCLAVLALGYSLKFPTSLSALVFWTARETGQDAADAWNQGKRAQAMKQPVLAFNLTQHFGVGGVGGVGGGVLTSFEKGAWRLYGELLREEGMRTWFDATRDVDDVVEALWAGLPPLEGVVGTSAGGSNEAQPISVTITVPGGKKGPPGGGQEETKENKNTTEKTTGGGEGEDQDQDENAKAVTRRLQMRSSIDMRSTMRKRAEAYFENFLAGRAAIARQALDDARRFGELVETHLVAPVTIDGGDKTQPAEKSETVGPEFHADVAAKFGSGSDQKWKKDKFAEVTVKNRTNYILSYAGLHLTARLLEVHQSLYAAARPEPDDFPADLKGQASSLLATTSKLDTFSVLTDLRRAEEAERKFLTDLIAQSTYGKVLATKKLLPLKKQPLGWTKQPTTMALEQLIGKAKELQGRLRSAGRNLAWLNERLAAQVAAETGAELKPENSTAGGASGAPKKVKDEDRKQLLYGDWAWSQTAGELVESWGRGVEEVAAAVRGNEEEARELVQRRKKREGAEDVEQDKGAAVARWRVDNCARASCYVDIVPGKPAAIDDEKKEWKSLIGWFWNKKAIAGDEKNPDEVKKEGVAPIREQKPLSGSGEGAKVTTVCDDDVTLEGKAACEKVCCGYSMHNEWADILMYGDRQFTYQDLYSGQPEAALV